MRCAPQLGQKPHFLHEAGTVHCGVVVRLLVPGDAFCAAMKRTKPEPAPTTAAAPERKVASERKTTIVAAGIALPHEPPSLVGQVVPIL